MNFHQSKSSSLLSLVNKHNNDREIMKKMNSPKKSTKIWKSLMKGLKSNINRFAKDTFNFEGRKWTKSGAINQIFVQDLKKYTMDSHKIVQGKYKDGDKLRITGRAVSKIFLDLRHIRARGGSATNTANLDKVIKKVRVLAVYVFASGKPLDEDSKDISIQAIKLPTRTRYLKDEEDNNKDMAFFYYPFFDLFQYVISRTGQMVKHK